MRRGGWWWPTVRVVLSTQAPLLTGWVVITGTYSRSPSPSWTEWHSQVYMVVSGLLSGRNGKWRRCTRSVTLRIPDWTWRTMSVMDTWLTPGLLSGLCDKWRCRSQTLIPGSQISNWTGLVTSTTNTCMVIFRLPVWVGRKTTTTVVCTRNKLPDP